MLDEKLLHSIKDKPLRELVQLLANQLEEALARIDLLQEENQRLKDEINRLKGEQGKPPIKPNKKPPDHPDPADTSPTDHSSQPYTKQPKTWSKDTKNDKIVLHATKKLEHDLQTLPQDVCFKGYHKHLVQNLLLKVENVCFLRAKFYSPSTGKTYLAALPPGYEGAFGPQLKALVLGLHHLGNVSQKPLHTLLTHAGIHISPGQINTLLLQGHQIFHQEKQDILKAGLASSAWQHSDTTLTRLQGVNQACHVLCNPLYTSYTTLPHKDRLSVLELLQGGETHFLLTEKVLASEAVRHLPQKWQKVLLRFPLNTPLSKPQTLAWLDTQMPTLGSHHQKGLLEAMAIASYLSQEEFGVVKTLVCDDAPVFLGLPCEVSLCWIHDARHYQKLVPHLRCFGEKLQAFQKRYWTYYRKLLAYREHPHPKKAKRLEAEFERLFTTETGYGALDYRIRQTYANKAKLLLVLSHPELPLHNNASELAVRVRVRKRDVSFGPRSALGLQAWDTFQTLLGTSQKLGVSFLDYLTDRVSGCHALPSLASLITLRASELNLSGSWT